MGDYFAFSQEVRREIEENNDLSARLDKHMAEIEKAEFIGQGKSNNHYRLGRLESGLWIAIREVRTPFYYRTLPSFLSRHESYAQKAEDYSRDGKRVTRFCVGAFKGKNAVLLIEDLTGGGAHSLHHDNDNEFGYLEGQKVYIDLESDEVEFEEFRFMNKDVSINL